VDDKINYAFSLAFTKSPDGIPQPHIIPNDDNDEINEVQWYTPAHVHQNEQSNKCVHFSESTKSPKFILYETQEVWTSFLKMGLESPNMLFTREPQHVGWSTL
jgi:hypothetical protein